MYKYDKLLEQLEGDLYHGSINIANLSARIIFNYIEERADLHPVDFKSNLLLLLKKISSVQPNMALIFNLIVGCLEKFDTKDLTKELKEFLERYTENIERSSNLIANNLRNILPNNCKIGTLSYSFAIKKSLEINQGIISSVYISESYPGGEGVLFANDIASIQSEINLFPDILWDKYINECDLILLGADTITEKSIINKTGSSLLTLLAKHQNIPVFILGSIYKLLPHRIYSQKGEKQYPISELDYEIDPKIKISFPIFIPVPLSDIKFIVTEEKIFKPEEIENQINKLRKRYNNLTFI